MRGGEEGRGKCGGVEAVLYLWIHFLQRLFLVEVNMKEHLLGEGEKMSVNIQQQVHGSVYNDIIMTSLSYVPHATSSTAHGRKHRPFFLHPLEMKRSASNSQRPRRLQCASLEEEGRREKGRRGRRKEEGKRQEREGEKEGEKEGNILIILMHIHVHSMNQ